MTFNKGTNTYLVHKAVNEREDNGRIINCTYSRMGPMSTNCPSILQKLFYERVGLHSRSGRVFHRCNKSRSAGKQSFVVACILEQNDRVDHMYSRNQTSLAVEMEPVQNYLHVSNGPLELVVSPRCQQL